MEVVLERLDDLQRLVLAHEAVVDEHARELIPDRLVHEQRGDRGVDAAGERAEHTRRPDLRAHPLDLLLDHRGGRPRRRGARDLVEEVLQQVLAVRRVHDLRVELHPVELAPRLLERCDGCRGRLSDDTRTLGRCGDGVAVRHPHRLLARQVAEQLALFSAELRLPELGGARPLDTPAEIERHQLRAVTDAERRDAELEDAGIDARRVLRVDRRRAAGEDHRVRVSRADLLRRHLVRDELGVHARVAHASRDQLCVLTTEVEHQHGALLRSRLGHRQPDDFSADSSAPPS